MKNKKKRILGLLLAAVMTVSMAAGCSKSGGRGSATGAKDSIVVATMSEPTSVGH